MGVISAPPPVPVMPVNAPMTNPEIAYNAGME
jgi:hypothetical protein